MKAKRCSRPCKKCGPYERKPWPITGMEAEPRTEDLTITLTPEEHSCLLGYVKFERNRYPGYVNGSKKWKDLQGKLEDGPIDCELIARFP